MCKQLSAQEELLSSDEMKGAGLTADKLLYLHAIDLCLNAGSSEFFGKAQQVRSLSLLWLIIMLGFSSVFNRTPKLKFSFTV